MTKLNMSYPVRACCGALWLLLSPPVGSSNVRMASVADTPVDAAYLVRASVAQASREHKEVLVIFTASWCHPCHSLTSFLEDPAMRPIFNRLFVTLVIYDGERDGNEQHRDTIGSHELRDAFHAREAGIPYFAILDSKGMKIIDSVRPVYGRRNERANIGYPGGPTGRGWFMEMMRLAVPSLSAGDRRAIEKWLIEHEGDSVQA